MKVRPGGSPPLVLASGWGTGGWSWDGLVSAFGDRHETRTFDPRGLGLSQTSLTDPGSWTPEEAVEDLHRVVAACEFPPVLLGASISGTIALALAARHPSSVQAVVAIGASPCHLRDETYPLGLDPAQAEAVAAMFRADFASAVRAVLPSVLLTDEERRDHPDLVQRLTDEAIEVRSPSLFLGLLGEFLKVDIRAVLPGIGVPILLVHGERDSSASPEVGRFLAERIPTAHLKVIPGAGHLPHLTRPAEVAAAISAFLG